MVNGVGGVPEYVSPACGFLMSNDHEADEWVEKLLWLEQNRDVPERMRPATRSWRNGSTGTSSRKTTRRCTGSAGARVIERGTTVRGAAFDRLRGDRALVAA